MMKFLYLKPGETIALEFTKDEILMINQALNEICNGIHFEDEEFAIRIGFERSEVTILLNEIRKKIMEYNLHDTIEEVQFTDEGETIIRYPKNKND